jgi:hypothetical protein
MTPFPPPPTSLSRLTFSSISNPVFVIIDVQGRKNFSPQSMVDINDDSLASSPETSSAWSPNSGNAPRGVSWFTRKHYLIKTKWIGGVSAVVFLICITVSIVSAIGANGGTCISTRGWFVISLYTSIFLIVVQALVLLIIAMKLSRHGNNNFPHASWYLIYFWISICLGRDALGIKQELLTIAIVVLIVAVIIYPTFVFILKLGDSWPFIAISIATFVWIRSIL